MSVSVDHLDHPLICQSLVGRELHLAALRLVMKSTRSGQGQVLLLSGEAGIGKSRLVAELKPSAHAEGFQVLEGKCFPADLVCPYAPLLDLLRSFLASLSPDEVIAVVSPHARELAPLLPEPIYQLLDLATQPPLPALEPEQAKRRLFAALTSLLLSQAAKQPLLLIVEDVHWTDESSLEFLHFLARQVAKQSLLLLCTYRNDEVSPALGHWLANVDRERLGQEIALPQLTRHETKTMLRAIFAARHPLPAEMLEAVCSLTEGNPFFIEEVLKALVMSGELVYTQERWQQKHQASWRIPRSVQDAVQQRLTRVSEPARQVLQLAAVAGRRFDVAVLQHLTQLDEPRFLEVMKALIAAQLVVEESAEQFVFRHALTQQAVYAGLLARERRTLHRQLGEAMEFLSSRPGALLDLAYHFYEAGHWEKAIEYAQRAGEQAQALCAPRIAVEQWTRAIQATKRLGGDVPGKFYRARGQAHETLGAFEEARVDYEQALHIAHKVGDGPLGWESTLDLGFLWAGRDYERAGVYFHQAVALAKQFGDASLQAHSLNRLGNWLLNTGRTQEALKTHAAALSLFEARHDRPGMAETQDLLGMAFGLAGDPVSAVRHCDQAVDLFRILGDQRGLASSLTTRAIFASPIEIAYSAQLNLADCIRDLTEALRLARQLQWAAGEAYTEIFFARTLTEFGRFSEALTHAEQGLRIATEIEHQQWMAAAHTTLGLIHIDILNPTVALQHLETALPLAQQLGSTFWLGEIASWWAQAALLLRNSMQAAAILGAVTPQPKLPEGVMERRVMWMSGELALVEGRPERALEIVEQLLQSAPRAPGMTEEQAIPCLLKCKGEALLALNRTEEAVIVLQDAQRGALLRYETPRLWKIQRSLGQACQRARREDEAQRAFAAARATVASLAVTIDDPALREHFCQAALATLPSGKLLPSRQAVAQQFGGLTEREREVAALIARGKSNREIASTLVVHYRTVETHVSHILSKLGFTSRAQIAVWAAERELVR